jgi:hypothetical protein
MGFFILNIDSELISQSISEVFQLECVGLGDNHLRFPVVEFREMNVTESKLGLHARHLGDIAPNIEPSADLRHSRALHDPSPRRQISGTQIAIPPQQKLRRKGNVRSFYERTPEMRSLADFFDSLGYLQTSQTANDLVCFDIQDRTSRTGRVEPPKSCSSAVNSYAAK